MLYILISLLALWFRIYLAWYCFYIKRDEKAAILGVRLTKIAAKYRGGPLLKVIIEMKPNSSDKTQATRKRREVNG